MVDNKDKYNLILIDAGVEKVKVIKVVRDVTGLGLKEAMDLVTGDTPKTIKKGVSKGEAEFVRDCFEDVGALIEITIDDELVVDDFKKEATEITNSIIGKDFYDEIKEAIEIDREREKKIHRRNTSIYNVMKYILIASLVVLVIVVLYYYWFVVIIGGILFLLLLGMLNKS